MVQCRQASGLSDTASWRQEVGSSSCRPAELTIARMKRSNHVFVTTAAAARLMGLPLLSTSRARSGPLSSRICGCVTTAGELAQHKRDLCWCCCGQPPHLGLRQQQLLGSQRIRRLLHAADAAAACWHALPGDVLCICLLLAL